MTPKSISQRAIRYQRANPKASYTEVARAIGAPNALSVSRALTKARASGLLPRKAGARRVLSPAAEEVIDAAQLVLLAWMGDVVDGGAALRTSLTRLQKAFEKYEGQ